MDTEQRPTPQNAPPSPQEDDAMLRRAVELGHEPTDVSARGLFIFAGALLATVVLTLLGLVVLFEGYEYGDRWLHARGTRDEPGARSLVHAPPDYQGPLLQVKPEEDLRWMDKHNAAALASYGWVDRPAGVVRIPVDRAIDVLAERGVPPVSPGLTLEAIQRQRADPQVYGQALRP